MFYTYIKTEKWSPLLNSFTVATHDRIALPRVVTGEGKRLSSQGVRGEVGSGDTGLLAGPEGRLVSYTDPRVLTFCPSSKWNLSRVNSSGMC